MRRLERLIQENRQFLVRYELALEADPSNFGHKLMVANLKQHLLDLENQLSGMLGTQQHSPALEGESMVASSGF